MWKTRFEVSTGSSPNLPRHRSLATSPTIGPRSSSSSFQSSPTVPRVREDSPSAILRPSSSSSIPNLAILTEEEETDLPCPAFSNSEQPSSALPKQTAYQTINKHRFVLPTIPETHDHEAPSDNRSDTDESNDPKHTTYAMREPDSLGALNTNYTQVTNGYAERKLPAKIEPTGFTINELLQPKHQRKSISASTDVAENDVPSPTTFKEISAFFENKASPVKATEQKKIVRAKRSLNLTRTVQEKNAAKCTLVASTAEQWSIFQRPMKRIKRSHQSSGESSESAASDRTMEQSFKAANLTHRWWALLLVTTVLLGYTYFSQVAPTHQQTVHQNRERTQYSDTALISCFAQAVRKQFFAFLDCFVTFIGQVFFQLEKHEYKHSIIYVLPSIFEDKSNPTAVG